MDQDQRRLRRRGGFRAAVADKSDPTTFDTNYNLTDKLHPNDAGYQAMANAIDLGLLK